MNSTIPESKADHPNGFHTINGGTGQQIRLQ